MAISLTTYRFLALGWMGFIFFLSHQRSLPLPMLFSGQDKLEHFCVYAILGVLVARSLAGQKVTNWRRVVLITVLTLLYGISDEYHQSFVPGRDVSALDAMADGLGGLLAAQFLNWWDNGVIKHNQVG